MPARCLIRALILFASLFNWLPGTSHAQLLIKNEDASLRVGFAGQVWANWSEASSGQSGYQQNFYLRRLRLMASADIGKDVSFFVETDAPRLGISPKNLSTGFILQDAMLEWKPRNQIQLAAGLFVAPFTRVGLQSISNYYALDFGSIAAVPNGVTQSSALRDVGFQLKGFFLDDRFQYRVGAFDGQRDANGRNSLRTAGYFQYNIFGRERGYALTGTALGKQKIWAIDAGIDAQSTYRGYSANTAIDLPVNGGDEIGGQFQYIFYDGRTKFPTIGRQNDYLVEAAYYVRTAKLQPFFKYETQQFTTIRSSNTYRTGFGVNYYIHGQNLKWTVQYQRFKPGAGSTLRPCNDLTAQLQFLYF